MADRTREPITPAEAASLAPAFALAGKTVRLLESVVEAGRRSFPFLPWPAGRGRGGAAAVRGQGPAVGPPRLRARALHPVRPRRPGRRPRAGRVGGRPADVGRPPARGPRRARRARRRRREPDLAWCWLATFARPVTSTVDHAEAGRWMLASSRRSNTAGVPDLLRRAPRARKCGESAAGGSRASSSEKLPAFERADIAVGPSASDRSAERSGKTSIVDALPSC